MKKLNPTYFAVSLILVLLLILFAGCSCVITTTPSPSPSPAPAITPVPTPAPSPINPEWIPPSADNQTEALPSIADVVAEVKPAVVAITTEVIARDFFNRPFTQEGAGSGWILDENGIIVTNNHVVENANTITITLDDGSTYTVGSDSIFTDRLNDLAILKVDARNLPALEIGDSAQLRVGDWVVAIGNALGQGIRATEGIVSRKKVSLPVSQGQTLYDLIETSAAINPGNSGGPLVNMTGEVIGITSAKIATIGVEGMGYAISAEATMPIIQQLVNNGYVVRPWLGVGLYTVDQIAIAQYNLSVDRGSLVLQVVPGSPADQTGLREGDVILSFAGQEIANVDELTRAIHSTEIGETVEIIYQRGDNRNTTTITAAESPPPP